MNEQTTTTRAMPIPASAGRPRNVDAQLFRAIREIGIRPNADALRVVRAIARGELAELAVRTDQRYKKGGKGKPESRKSIIAIWQTQFPPDATVWINDTTTDPAPLEAMVGKPVIDMTPAGDVAAQHPTVQVPLDVTKSTAPKTVVQILRGVLLALLAFSRIGIIIDKKHVPVIKGTAKKPPCLDEPLRNRISKIEHWRGGESRGANSWLGECDLILVVGTPRVPPSAIRTRLIQTGNILAAGRDGEWDCDYWSGIDIAGCRHTICNPSYKDRDWDISHHAVVRSEILQAVGRGRTILPDGMPVVIVTTENMGLPLASVDIPLVSDAALEVLSIVAE